MDTSRSSKGSLLQDIWTIFGISLLLIAVIECLLTRHYTNVDEKLIQNQFTERAHSGAYADADWTGEYFKELYEASASIHWTPYVHTIVSAYEGRYINIDADGSRKTWNAPVANENGRPLKIFFFGGSVLWGFGARDEFTIPSIVSKRLAENGFHASVSNYGVNGDASSQQLIRLVLELKKGNTPDLVVIYGGQIDSLSACSEGRPGAPYGNARVERQLSGRTSLERLKLQIIDYTTHNLGLVRFAKNLTGAPQDITAQWGMICSPNDPSTDTLADQTLAVYLDNLRFIQSMSAAFSFRTLFYFEPQLADKTRRTAYEERRFEEAGVKFPGASDLYARTRDKFLKMEAGAGQPQIHDLRGTFSEEAGPIYIDSGHLGEIGNERVANQIAADILAMPHR